MGGPPASSWNMGVQAGRAEGRSLPQADRWRRDGDGRSCRASALQPAAELKLCGYKPWRVGYSSGCQRFESFLATAGIVVTATQAPERIRRRSLGKPRRSALRAAI